VIIVAAAGITASITDQQDLTARRDGLIGLGVLAHRIYVDHGLAGTNRQRPGLPTSSGCGPRKG
jgi:hypothetical protein